MAELGRDCDESRCVINRRCLHSGDFMFAQGFAHNLQAARQRCVAENLLAAAFTVCPDGGDHRLFWIDELNLRLGEGSR